MRSNRIRLGLFASALFILALCLSSVVLNAQTYTEGALAGTVFDSTGAVVPGASISIVNNGTNAEISLKSDGSGYYKAPEVPPGTYTVTITGPGFETFKEVGVIVVVNEVTEVSPHMVTGAATTNVEVTGEAPVLNFESPEISSTLSTHDLQDIPLNGGRWSDMALLTPGAVGDSNGFGLVSFRGITPTQNNVEVDGADDNQAYYAEERGRTREGYSTSKYAIDEFTVNTGVYSTEYGRAAGGVINAVTKSGTNTLHGIAYFSDRDNDWGTTNPFTTNTVNTGTATAPTFVTSPYKPVDWRKEWGFDAGGTLKKDKLFWFYGFNQYDRNFPGTAKAGNPSTVFTLPDATLGSALTCNITGTHAGYISTTGSAASTIDQSACELAARLATNGINVPGVGVPSTYAMGATAYDAMLVNLLGDLGTVPRRGYEELNTPKLDWQINEKNHVSFLYHRLRWDSPGGVQTQATNTYAIDSFGMDFVKVDYGLAKLDSQITTNISNEVRYQFGRELNDEGQQPLSSFSKQYMEGFNGVTAAGGGLSPNIPYAALDSPTGTGFYLGSEYYDYRKALPDEHKWQVGDTAAWIHGNHDFKFGIDMIHNYDLINNTFEGNGYYTYSYITNFFADVYNEGYAAAKGLGICNSVSSVTAPGSTTVNYTGTAPCGTMVQGFGPPVWSINTTDYGVFGEDHWKLSPRLTFDVGLRWDYEALPPIYPSLVVPNGSFAPLLGTTSGNNGLCLNTNGSGTVFQYGVTSPSTQPGTCPALAANANMTNDPSDKLNFGPRIGLAYDPFGSGKTTVRIGYGMYFGRIQNGTLINILYDTGSPAGQYTSASFKPNTAGSPLFPNIVSSGTFSSPTAYFFSKGFRNPEIHEFDASVQQEVGRGTIFQLSYMGALSRELANALNINLNPNVSTSTTSTPNGVNNSVMLFYDTSGMGPIPSGTTFTVPTYNNYIDSNFGAVNELFSNGNANYEAMVAEIQNRTSKLIQFDVNYTWSHALDWNQGEYTTTISSGWQDPYNIDGFYKGANYGISEFNVGNRVVAYALLNSPTVNTSNQFLKAVANDWSFNPVFQGQNGLPYSAETTNGYVSTSAEGEYSVNGATGAASSWIPWVGRNTYDQPRTLVLDMRLEKQFTIPVQDKPYHLQLMGEMFNVANHPNITGVNVNAYSLSSNSSTTSTCANPAGGTFGAITGQPAIECSSATYLPRTANAGTIGNFNNQGGFGAATSANSNFAYSVRQVMITMRIEW